MIHVLRTDSVDATRDLGAAVAGLVRSGDVIVLAGELGAGKTAFAQGFGRALGVTDQITSPTFVLAREYEGTRLAMHHLDVYRLDQMNEVFDIGLPELLDDGVTLVEWGDAILPALPADFLEVRLTFGDGDDERRIAVRPVGPRWAARAEALEQAVAAWALDRAEGPSC